MKDRRRRPVGPLLAFILLFMPAVSAVADDADDLAVLLRSFLDGVTDADTHNRFWAEDLIYTSSRGTRSTKAEIMAGFAEPAEGNATAGPTYAAEDVQIQIYGTSAIVAFRLIATPPDGSGVQEYLNTGTFLHRDDQWQAVAWQATIVPGTIIPLQ